MGGARCQLSISPSYSKFRTRFTTLRRVTMTIARSNHRTEITLQPPPFVSEQQFIGYGLYGRIELLLDDRSRCFKFCEPNNQDAVATIEREKNIFAILGPHPSIIQPHWVSERGLCFEYYPKGSLRAYYKTMLPSLPDIRTRPRWCRQIVEGIAFIHSKDIVHNDISARNVLVSQSMDIKICDFGSATKVGEEVLDMPEERYVKYRHGRIYARVQDDLFTVGSLFYEILEGNQPYQRVESPEVRRLFNSLVFPPLNHMQPDYLARVIRKCWNEEYNSISELQVDLNQS